MDFRSIPLTARPSDPDERDYRVLAAAPVALPVAYSLEHQAQPIRNQGQEGTCVGHALASGVLGQALVKSGRAGRILSVRDAYEQSRALEPPTSAEGTQPRNALKAAQRTGICYEADWPYVAGSRGVETPNAARARTMSRVGEYRGVGTSVPELRAALHQHGALLIVIPVYDGFYRVDGRGFVGAAGGQVLGYHAMAAVGWDDGLGALRVRNSWGREWAQGGYHWQPYEYGLTEAWAVTRADFLDVWAEPRAPQWYDPLRGIWPFSLLP